MDRRALSAGRRRCVRASRREGGESGLTLIELLIVIALIGIIAALAVPVFVQQLERMKVRRAIADLATIEFEIERYETQNDVLPDSVDDLERPLPVDPWGHAYIYLRFGGPGWRGEARKDRFLVPINSSFDLYSVGRDGETRPPLQVPVSFDDIVRANDGAFYGLGKDF